MKGWGKGMTPEGFLFTFLAFILLIVIITVVVVASSVSGAVAGIVDDEDGLMNE